MANSAQIAANRLNAQEGTEPRDAQGARRRCGGTVAASARGARQHHAPQPPRGRSRENRTLG